jgi:hypothetical protein
MLIAAKRGEIGKLVASIDAIDACILARINYRWRVMRNKNAAWLDATPRLV